MSGWFAGVEKFLPCGESSLVFSVHESGDVFVGDACSVGELLLCELVGPACNIGPHLVDECLLQWNHSAPSPTMASVMVTPMNVATAASAPM